MTILLSGILALCFTVASEKTKSPEACQLYSIVGGFLWGVAFTLFLFAP